jgi:hypothetical protein
MMDRSAAFCTAWGKMRQYDVTEPRKPKLAGSVHVGGIARRTAHPSGKAYAGGSQMVEISRDGKRVYWTNSRYSSPCFAGRGSGAAVSEQLTGIRDAKALHISNYTSSKFLLELTNILKFLEILSETAGRRTP